MYLSKLRNFFNIGKNRYRQSHAMSIIKSGVPCAVSCSNIGKEIRHGQSTVSSRDVMLLFFFCSFYSSPSSVVEFAPNIQFVLFISKVIHYEWIDARRARGNGQAETARRPGRGEHAASGLRIHFAYHAGWQPPLRRCNRQPIQELRKWLSSGLVRRLGRSRHSINHAGVFHQACLEFRRC